MQYQISIDFTVPRVAVKISSYPRLYIPVAWVGKRLLNSVDIRDESGVAIPAMNLHDEMELTALAIESYCLANHPNPDLAEAARAADPATAKLLRRVVYERPPGSEAAAKEFIESDPVKALVGSPTAHAAVSELVTALAKQSWLYAVLRGVEPEVRRLIKVRYVDAFPDIDAVSDPNTERGLVRWWLALRDRSASWGLAATQVFVPIPKGTSESFHLEFKAPEGLAFVDGYLSKGSGPHRVLHDQVPVGVRLCHLYRQAEHRGDDVEAETFLLPERGGWQRTAAIAATTVALSCWWIGRYLEDLQRVRNAPTAAAAFIGVGAIVVVFLATRFENPLTRKLLRGARALLLISVVAAVVSVAMLLLVRVPPDVAASPPTEMSPRRADPASTIRPNRSHTVDGSAATLGPLETWRWRLAVGSTVPALALWVGSALWWVEDQKRRRFARGARTQDET